VLEEKRKRLKVATEKLVSSGQKLPVESTMRPLEKRPWCPVTPKSRIFSSPIKDTRSFSPSQLQTTRYRLKDSTINVTTIERTQPKEEKVLKFRSGQSLSRFSPKLVMGLYKSKEVEFDAARIVARLGSSYRNSNSSIHIGVLRTPSPVRPVVDVNGGRFAMNKTV